jgi:hypothetical protein
MGEILRGEQGKGPSKFETLSKAVRFPNQRFMNPAIRELMAPAGWGKAGTASDGHESALP